MSESVALFCRPMMVTDVLAALRTVALELKWPNEVSITVRTPIPQVIFSVTVKANGEETDESKDTVARAQELGALPARESTLEAADQDRPLITYRCEDDQMGRLFFSDGRPRANAAVKLLPLARAAFKATPTMDLMESGAGPQANAVLQVRERNAAELRQTVDQLGQFLADLGKRQVAHQEAIEAKLSTAHQERMTQLEQAHLARQKSLDDEDRNARERRAKDEEAFNARVARIDSRESKHVRRALLTKLEEVLAGLETMSLSGPTGRKRRWVFWGCAALAAAGAAVAATMLIKVYGAAEFDWHLLAPFSAGFLCFVFTTIYYLKWSDRWFREHADAELAAKRYRADMVRASWIAELVQEPAADGKGDLPPELIAAYTRGLFADVGPSHVSEHPMDNLAALMKRASEVRIGKDGLMLRSTRRPKRGRSSTMSDSEA